MTSATETPSYKDRGLPEPVLTSPLAQYVSHICYTVGNMETSTMEHQEEIFLEAERLKILALEQVRTEAPEGLAGNIIDGRLKNLAAQQARQNSEAAAFSAGLIKLEEYRNTRKSKQGEGKDVKVPVVQR